MQNNRFKSLLIALDSDEGATHLSALEYALDIAHACQSRVTAYVFAPALLQPFPLTFGSSTVWIAQETDRIETLSEQVAQVIQKRAQERSVPITVEHAHSPFDGRYSRFIVLARLHDLTILPAVEPSGFNSRRTAIEHVLFDAGCPVLLTSHDKFEVPKRMAIAWDGSAQAARAVRGGLDLLVEADHVAITTVLDKKGSEGLRSADDLMAYLALYGARSEIVVIADAPGNDEGHALRQFVVDQQMDLLIMGAFVHSRLRQTILGGMTHSILENCPIPVVMSH